MPNESLEITWRVLKSNGGWHWIATAANGKRIGACVEPFAQRRRCTQNAQMFGAPLELRELAVAKSFAKRIGSGEFHARTDLQTLSTHSAIVRSCSKAGRR